MQGGQRDKHRSLVQLVDYPPTVSAASSQIRPEMAASPLWLTLQARCIAVQCPVGQWPVGLRFRRWSEGAQEPRPVKDERAPGLTLISLTPVKCNKLLAYFLPSSETLMISLSPASSDSPLILNLDFDDVEAVNKPAKSEWVRSCMMI